MADKKINEGSEESCAKRSRAAIVSHVTQSDINMIEHFLIEREDMTRWTEWENRKEIIKLELPELVNAIDKFEYYRGRAKKLAEYLIDSIHKYPDD